MRSREPENDVDGTGLIIDASYHPEMSPEDRAELQQIVHSIRFEPSLPGAVGSRRYLNAAEHKRQPIWLWCATRGYGASTCAPFEVEVRRAGMFERVKGLM